MALIILKIVSGCFFANFEKMLFLVNKYAII